MHVILSSIEFVSNG